MSSTKKLFIFRTDRLGDVLMSLPTAVLMRTALPDWEITFVCRMSHHPVLEPLLKNYRIDLLAPHHQMLQNKPDAVLFLYSESQYQWAALKEGIKVRVGGRSKWFSFFCLTKSVRQRRSRAEKNEAQYNLELAHSLLDQLGQSYRQKPAKILLPVNETAKQNAETALDRVGVKPPYVVVHPGMGGSALNLNPAQYVELVKTLGLKYRVVVTSGPAPADQEVKAILLKNLPDLKVVEGISIDNLAEIFRQASIVVAPSTGPLHLAHLVGTKTIGIFSPVRTHHPDRWAPYGGSAPVKVILPQVKCPGTSECLGPKCSEYLCMDKVDWAKLAEAAANESEGKK